MIKVGYPLAQEYPLAEVTNPRRSDKGKHCIRTIPH